jgi:hypothetical protein
MEKAGRAQPRLLLLFAVLAGLFLMHGLSAASGSGCHNGMPAMSAAAADAVPGSPLDAMPDSMPGTASAVSPVSMAAMPAMSAMPAMAAPMSDHQAAPMAHARLTEPAMSSETCVPLRPDDVSGLVLALFAVILWRTADPCVAHSIRALPRWPHGPPRRGSELLKDLSVCRT